MEIVLLQDVKKLGKKGEIVSVADGLAQNSLIPSGKAVVATKEYKAKLISIQKNNQLHKDAKSKQKEVIVNTLVQKGGVVLIRRADVRSGHLYQSVTAADIASTIQQYIPDQLRSVVVPNDILIIDNTIKTVGVYTVKYCDIPIAVTIQSE